MRGTYVDPNTNIRYDTNNADFEGEGDGAYVSAVCVCVYVKTVRGREVYGRSRRRKGGAQQQQFKEISIPNQPQARAHLARSLPFL